MIVWGWWTRGAEAAGQTQAAEGPQWVYPMQGQHKQVIDPRTRPNNEIAVQFGDFRSSSRTLDTWEGEAT